MSDLSQFQNLFASCSHIKLIESYFPHLFSDNRNVLVVVLAVWECWTHTGLPKTRRTNTSKSSSSIQPTMPSVVTRKSTGSADLCRNIVNCVVLHRPARALVVLAKATVTPKLSVDHVVLPGAAEIVSTCTANDKLVRQDDKIVWFFFVCFSCRHFMLVHWNVRSNNIFNNTTKTDYIKWIIFSNINVASIALFFLFLLPFLNCMHLLSDRAIDICYMAASSLWHVPRLSLFLLTLNYMFSLSYGKDFLSAPHLLK